MDHRVKPGDDDWAPFRSPEETGDTSNIAPARSASPLPQHSMPVEATERRIHSKTSNLSANTLKAMLEVQEQEGVLAAGGAPAVAKD